MSFEPRDYLRHIQVEIDYLIAESGGGPRLTGFSTTPPFSVPSSAVSRSLGKRPNGFPTHSERNIHKLPCAKWPA